jgi:hypothetical protein
MEICTPPPVRSHSSEPAENLLLQQADIAAKAAFESSEFLSSDCAIASSPSEDIEALVQKVRSYFNKTIQYEYANLCTFNPRFNRRMKLGKLSTMYVQTELNESDDYDSSGFSQERQSWKKVVLEKPQLMVLGKPGAGKTTLLHYIALHCDQIEFNPKLVPVFISLKTLAENVKHPDEIDILRYIQKEYCGSNISEQEIKYLLDRGRILLLLDGLDEVPDEKVGTLIQKINSLSPRLVDKRFIVSCRKESRAYISNKLFKFFLCKVANFEEQQITEFINNWFSQSRVGTSQEREALANKLDTKLKDQQNKRIRELADTPLLLHLICLIFQENRDLPSKRVEIYKQGINLLLEKWNQFNDRTQVNVEELRKALRGIAAITFENGKSFFEEGEVLRFIEHCPIKLSDIEVSSGLLVNKGWDIYAFSHQTFQEYLTAEYFVEDQDYWPTPVSYIREERWHKVFILMCELLPTPTKFILLMQTEIIRLSQTNRDLQYFLNKAYQKSHEIISCYKPAAIRVFYFLSSIILSNFSCCVEEFLGYGVFSTYEIIQLARIIDNKFSLLDRETQNRYKVISDIEMDYRLIRVFELASELNEIASQLEQSFLELQDFYHVYCELERTFYFNISLDLPGNRKIIEVSQHLKSKLPDPEDKPDKIMRWWAVQGGAWLEELQDWIVESRQIFPKYLAEGNLEAAWQYYKLNKLLINCLNSGCNVSPEVRSHIENNLFLPLDSSLS